MRRRGWAFRGVGEGNGVEGSADDDDAERGGERDEGAERAAAVRVEAAADDHGEAAAEPELLDSRNGGRGEE